MAAILSFTIVPAILFLFALWWGYRQKKQEAREDVHWAGLAESLFEQHGKSPEHPAKRVDSLLRASGKKLGLSHAMLVHHHGETCTVLNLVSDGYETPQYISQGQVNPRSLLFCGELGEKRESLAIDFASLSEWRKHPSFHQLGWETYLGSRIPLSKGEWMTVAFFDSRARDSLYQKMEKQFVQQLGQWIMVTLDKENSLPSHETGAARAQASVQ